MSNILLMHEGGHVDNDGHLISPIYVDLRKPADRLPITTLVKGCHKQYAIELSKRLRISKPARFREYGERLIRDPREVRVSHTKLVAERIDDPDDLAEAQSVNDEFNKAAELLQFGATFTTKSTRMTRRTTHSLSSEKNGWILSTSIEPLGQEEKDIWQESMPDEYDHTSYIHRPREFARALASMVAEQLGPQGNETELKHSWGGGHKIRTKHKVQVIYHGPVIYVEDPYEVIFDASSRFEFMMLPIFVKGIAYRGQREYRFAIMAAEEPSDDFVDLDVSLAMLGTMQEHCRGYSQQALPTVFPTEAQCVHGHELVTEEEQEDSSLPSDAQTRPSLLDLVNDPSTPVAPHSYDVTDLPEDLHELTTTYASISILQRLVGRLSRRRIVEAASSAWHAEPCIRRLCAMFEDPIENISVSDDNFIIITIKFPAESRSEGTIAVGPRGTSTCMIKDGDRPVYSRYRWAWLMKFTIGEDLERAGLRVRRLRPSAGDGAP